MKALPALRAHKVQPEAAGDGQLPTQTTLYVIFTPALCPTVLWGEKMEAAVRKISIRTTIVLSAIALILCGLYKHPIDHVCLSSSILLLICMQLNFALGSWEGSATEGKYPGLCTAAVSHSISKILPMKWM